MSLELDDGAPGRVELVLRAADSTCASNGLLLRDPAGNLSLAWRGGLLGSSERKNQTLWSQCRLSTLSVPAPGSGAASETAERVALVARAGTELLPQLVAFAEEVRRLRDLLAPRERKAAGAGYADFATLEPNEQAELLWPYLIGLGALPLDEAVNVSAQGLRGYVQYERLRRDGPLYELLSRLLAREASAGARFDRPGRGQVRAIQPELDHYAREDWLDCLVNALPEGEALDRATAMRLIFSYARDTWGLAAQRLRSGGKSEKALKSSLNSAIRRGLLRRVGAAYVEKVTASTGARGGSVPPPASNAPQAAQDIPTASAQTPSESKPEEATPIETAPVSESPNPPDTTDDPLARPLHELPLPVRTLNWAERQGLTQLRDLAAWHPDAFATQPNVGRLTVTETRLALETALGREWEDIWGELEEPKTPPPGADPDDPDVASGPLPSADASRWNRRHAELSEAQQALLLTRLDLPGTHARLLRATGSSDRGRAVHGPTRRAARPAQPRSRLAAADAHRCGRGPAGARSAGPR